MTKTQNERGALGVGAAVVLGVLGLVVLVVGGYFIQYVTAEPRGKLDQREKTIANGDYRIAAYDSFYNLCGNIQAKEDAIKNTEERATTESTESGFSPAQKDSILLALKNSRASLIRQYNADATKADTKANFLASDLPYQINPNGETVCAAS